MRLTRGGRAAETLRRPIACGIRFLILAPPADKGVVRIPPQVIAETMHIVEAIAILEYLDLITRKLWLNQAR